MKEFTKIMILGGLGYIGGSSSGLAGALVGAVVAISIFYLVEELVEGKGQ